MPTCPAVHRRVSLNCLCCLPREFFCSMFPRRRISLAALCAGLRRLVWYASRAA
jgi:hypothetical protein